MTCQVNILSHALSGRGVYSNSIIMRDAPIGHGSTPFAYVILRKFRKEVCGWCFGYAWDSKKVITLAKTSPISN